MEPENTTPTQGGQGAGESASEAGTAADFLELIQNLKDSIPNVVNAAVTNRMKRERSQVEQYAAEIEALKKEIASFKSKAEAPAASQTESDAPKPNKELLDLREMYERLEKKNLENEARAKAVEEKARWDGLRNDARKALEGKAVSGVRADAQIALWIESKALRFDEDGSPKLFVTRARGGKGAQPEEIGWSIIEGVDDWSKSPQAAEFLPAPTTTQNRNGYGSQMNGSRRGVVHYDKPAGSIEEATRRAEEMLVNRGVDINEAFRR